MFCENCGVQLMDHERFCHNCGASIQSADNAQPVHQEKSEVNSSTPVKKKKPKIIIISAVGVVAGILIWIFAGVLLPALNLDGKETVYLLTQKTKYNSSGLTMAITEYQYDEAMRLCGQEEWQLEERLVYDPIYDCDVFVYDEECEMKHSSISVFEHDTNGNPTRIHVCSHEYGYDGYYTDARYYEYGYDDDGNVVSWSMSANNEIVHEYTMEYDENGNPCAIIYEVDSYNRIVSEFEYDRYNRLIQESHYSRGDNYRIVYLYDGGKLIQAEIYWTYDPSSYSADTIFRTVVYTYADDRLTTEIFYDSDGKERKKYLYSYNITGVLTKKECYVDGEFYESCTYDIHGNIVEAMNDEGRTIYEYKAVKATPSQAILHKRRYAIFYESPIEQWFSYKYTLPSYYCVIPHPDEFLEWQP